MAYHGSTPDEIYPDFEPMLGLKTDEKSRSEMRCQGAPGRCLLFFETQANVVILGPGGRLVDSWRMRAV